MFLQTKRSRNPYLERDFIMIVTPEGQVQTLRLRDILRVQSDYQMGQCRVMYQNGTHQRMVVVLEPASEFQQRCKGLQQALECEDCMLIEQFYTPKRPNKLHL